MQTSVSQSFPWGIFRRNGHRVLFPDGKIRACELASTADSFFSVPASARVNGKRFSGYMTTEESAKGERVYCFRPHDGQAWPIQGSPEWTKLGLA